MKKRERKRQVEERKRKMPADWADAKGTKPVLPREPSSDASTSKAKRKRKRNRKRREKENIVEKEAS